MKQTIGRLVAILVLLGAILVLGGCDDLTFSDWERLEKSRFWNIYVLREDQEVFQDMAVGRPRYMGRAVEYQPTGEFETFASNGGETMMLPPRTVIYLAEGDTLFLSTRDLPI